MRILPLVFVLAAVLAAGTAWAQSIRIGVVTDLSGDAAAAVEAVVAAFETRVRSQGGVFGVSVEVLVRDGRGDPAATSTALARLATEDRVHALACCADPRTARAAVAVAAEHQLPLLLWTVPGTDPAPWSFVLAPSPRTELRAVVGHAYSEGRWSLGLMTLDNAFGDLPERVLLEELGVAGMELAVVARYAPNAAVLTPEALWVATRQPGAVVVWGLAQDTRIAVAALRARGYEGPVYARAELLEDPSSGIDPATFAGVRFAVPPIEVDDAAATTPGLEAAARLRDVAWGLFGVRDVPADAARAYDALDLVRAAAEQAAVYGVSPDDVASYRVALRDAAISLPPFVGAAGTYEFDDPGGQAALPSGLVIVELSGASRVAVSP